MYLSAHFTLADLTKSATAVRRNISNTPDETEVQRLRLLCASVLEPLFARYGAKLIITSGYRSIALNKAIGGSRNSQHMLGEAADLVVAGVPNLTVARWLEKNVKFGQLIHEFGEWVHVSLPRGQKKPETLTCFRSGDKVIYEHGLKEIPK